MTEPSTRRERIATAVLAGFADENVEYDGKLYAKRALEWADALIAALDAEPEAK